MYRAPDGADEPLALSPAHLLTLKTPYSHEAVAATEKDLLAYGSRRWLRVQHLANEFWCLWRDHYLQELTTWRKWSRECPNLTEGDVVLVKDKSAPRGDWKMARVLNPIHGRDGLVRRASVKLVNTGGKSRVSERAVTDLVLLHSPQPAGARECAV